MQLEDNFFHNQPTSVRKTTDFVVERVSSNVIKTLRSKVLPTLRETALGKVCLGPLFHPSDYYSHELLVICVTCIFFKLTMTMFVNSVNSCMLDQ